MEAAAPLWTRNPEHSSSSGGPRRQGRDTSGSSSHRVQARQRGFGAQEAPVLLAQLGHSLDEICQKSGCIETQAEASYVGGRRKSPAGWLSAWQVTQWAQTMVVSEQEAVGGHSSSLWKFGKYCVRQKKKEGWKIPAVISRWGSYRGCFTPLSPSSPTQKGRDLSHRGRAQVQRPPRFRFGCKFRLVPLLAICTGEKGCKLKMCRKNRNYRAILIFPAFGKSNEVPLDGSAGGGLFILSRPLPPGGQNQPWPSNTTAA